MAAEVLGRKAKVMAEGRRKILVSAKPRAASVQFDQKNLSDSLSAILD
jgi:hypothetical protein